MFAQVMECHCEEWIEKTEEDFHGFEKFSENCRTKVERLFQEGDINFVHLW